MEVVAPFDLCVMRFGIFERMLTITSRGKRHSRVSTSR